MKKTQKKNEKSEPWMIPYNLHPTALSADIVDGELSSVTPEYVPFDSVSFLDKEIVGFVYEIQNKVDSKYYIGKKLFTKAGYKQVKGKRKKIRKESTWKEYYGSSAELLEDVKKHGKHNFTRHILKLCKSKGELSYFEAKYQFNNNVLYDKMSYNTWIQCKIHKKHLKA
jgi:hypothetical protein